MTDEYRVVYVRGFDVGDDSVNEVRDPQFVAGMGVATGELRSYGGRAQLRYNRQPAPSTTAPTVDQDERHRRIIEGASAQVSLAAVDADGAAGDVAGVGAAEHHHRASDVLLAVADVAQRDAGAVRSGAVGIELLPALVRG